MTREEFIELASSRYDEIDALNTNHKDSFYDYEKEFVRLWQDMGRNVLEKNISGPSKDRRKKKLYQSGRNRD